MNTKHKPLILSIGLHIGIILVLVLGDFNPTAKPMPVVSQVTPIQAVVIDQAKVDSQVKKLKKQKSDAVAAEKKRLKDAEQRLANAKKKRLQEEARIKDLERQRKKKVQEKKNADDAAKKSKAKAAAAEKDRKKKVAEQKQANELAAAKAKAKAKRLKEQAAAKKAADKKAADKRKKAAAEKKRKEQEAKERAVQDRLLEQQMAEEMAGRAQARRQQMMSEISRFSVLIKETIQRHLIRDRSSMEGKSCKLTISLTPSGFVTNVVIGQGNRIVCDAAQKAIYKAGTLPVSKDPEIFKEMRKISVTVIPEF